MVYHVPVANIVPDPVNGNYHIVGIAGNTMAGSNVYRPSRQAKSIGAAWTHEVAR